ncbi:MAG: TIGR02594 family protein, partial [Paracoccaceae bacterium]
MALPDEPLLGALGANPYWARNWLLFGQAVTTPIIGAVLIFARGQGGHVGFAIGQDDAHFFVLGGNQSDAVTIARIAKSRLLGARWPATYPPRLQRLPTMKPGAFLSTTNEN